MVETRQLCKRYGSKTAVDGLDLSIRDGELFSLLGVNGAGKTTTIRMLSCLSTPTQGEAFVGGYDVRTQAGQIKRMIGVSPQDTAVADRLTVRENLRMMGGLYGFSAERALERVERMIADFHLAEVADQQARTLSGGWQRRLSIAMALISEPKLLFLDEPTLGLDVLARRELWRVIEGLKGRMTVVLTTHYMEEAERLSDRIAIMIAGRIAACGTLAEIKAMTGAEDLESAFVAIAEKEGAA